MESISGGTYDMDGVMANTSNKRKKVKLREKTFESTWLNKGGLKKQEAVFVVEYLKDFGARRAAIAAGLDPDMGYKLLEENLVVKAAIHDAVTEALGILEIDPTWLLEELLDNHRIARAHGNINASNAALRMMMQHVDIDAVAKQKVETTIIDETALTERLHRGRQRIAKVDTDTQEVSFL